MNKDLVKTYAPLIMNSLAGNYEFKDISEQAVEYILNLFVKSSGTYTDAKQVSGIFRIINLVGDIPQTRKIGKEVLFVIPTFVDDRKYNMGDDVVIHPELEDLNNNVRPIITKVIHYMFNNIFMDIIIMKSFVNDEQQFDAYVAKARSIGFKTSEEMEAITSATAESSAATPDNSSEDVSPAALGPQIVES